MASLLLTRGEVKNRQLMQQFDQQFEEVRSLPLFRAITRNPGEIGKNHILGLDTFDHVIFISENAVQFGLPLLQEYWPAWPISLTFLAVGPATAGALTRLDPVILPRVPDIASSEGLLALPELKQVEDKKILIVRGQGGRETLKENLTTRGARVHYLEVYQRVRIPYPARELDALLPPVLSLVYSGEALEYLREMVGARAREYEVVVPSTRLQMMAYDLGFKGAYLAESQEEANMAKVVETWLT